MSEINSHKKVIKHWFQTLSTTQELSLLQQLLCRGCEQPESGRNGKERASTVALQAAHQRPVPGCVRQTETATIKRRGEGFHCEKGKSGVPTGIRKKERSWVWHPFLQSSTPGSAPKDSKVQPGSPSSSFGSLISASFRVMLDFLLLQLKILQSGVQCFSLLSWTAIIFWFLNWSWNCIWWTWQTSCCYCFSISSHPCNE